MKPEGSCLNRCAKLGKTINIHIYAILKKKGRIVEFNSNASGHVM